jgi:hypothetical protein
MPPDELTPAIVKVVLLGPRVIPALNTLSPEDLVMVRYLYQEGAKAYASIWVEMKRFCEAKRCASASARPRIPASFFYSEELRTANGHTPKNKHSENRHGDDGTRTGAARGAALGGHGHRGP